MKQDASDRFLSFLRQRVQSEDGHAVLTADEGFLSLSLRAGGVELLTVEGIPSGDLDDDSGDALVDARIGDEGELAVLLPFLRQLPDSMWWPLEVAITRT